MIRRYRVSTNSETYTVEAESPKNAIRFAYNNHNIRIETASESMYTHRVKLLGALRDSVRYYIVHDETLKRKPKPANYIEPMPKKQLQKLVKDFRDKGGIIIMDEASEAHLRSKNAEGVTYNSTTILLTRNPGRSVVYEELIHAEQFRQGKNDGSYEKRLLCEIEAQEMLIKKKKELNITDIEDKQTRLALKAYKKEYEQFKNSQRKGGK